MTETASTTPILDHRGGDGMMRRCIDCIRREYPAAAGAVPGDPKFDQLLDSIRRDGIREPIIIDPFGRVLDGHHRLEAARMVGMLSVPVRVWTGRDYA